MLMMKKREESDIDTVELRQKLEELTLVQASIKQKDNCINTLTNKVQELTEAIEKEQLMNENNRDLMNEMQREVRDARIERKKAVSIP